MRAVLLLVGLALQYPLLSQIFDEVALDYGIEIYSQGYVGAGVTVYDYNGDNLPDLSIPDHETGIRRYLNTGNGFIEDDILTLPFLTGEYEMACYADYDNDGDADVFITRSYGGSGLLQNVDGIYIDVSYDAGIIFDIEAFTHGASWGDVDKDGYLDLYVCNYEWNQSPTNWFYKNNGDGTFTECAVELGINGFELPTWQSVFLDYDQDTWPDLFVINDKTPPSNFLYHNNGDGTFTDVSEEMGVNQAIDAMTNSPYDYDDDGDLDIFVTNNPGGNLFLRNDGDSFTEIADDLGVSINEWCWGAVWMDFDNNMTDDLYVTTSTPLGSADNYLYSNNGNGGFNQVSFQGMDHRFASVSVACGDFNLDGYMDLLCGGLNPYRVRVFENNGGSRNAVTVKLEGVVSNRDGIGSWVRYWIDGHQKNRYTQCGGQFLSQNDKALVLPCSYHTSIDSLEVTWPSGHVEKHYDLQAGEPLLLREGDSFNPVIVNNQNVICNGDSLLLTTSNGLPAQWSNGAESDHIWVSNQGSYSFQQINEFGIEGFSNNLFVIVSASLNVLTEVNDVSCAGANDGTISVQVTPAPASTQWSNESNDLVQSNLAPGEYTLTLENNFGCEQAITVEIEQPDPIEFSYEVTPPSCHDSQDGQMVFSANGGVGPFDYDFEGFDPLAMPEGTHHLVVTDSTGCSLSLEIQVTGPEMIEVNPDVTNAIEGENGAISLYPEGGTPPYSVNWSNGQSGTDLEEVDAGTYFYYLLDDNGCQLNGQVTVESVVDIHEKEKSISIYPNPADDYLNLSGTTFQAFKLTDSSGKLILDEPISTSYPRIITSNLPNGSYILYLYNASTTAQVRVQIMH